MIICSRKDCSSKYIEVNDTSLYWMFGDRSGIAVCSDLCRDEMLRDCIEDEINMKKSDSEWREVWDRIEDLRDMK